jgi:1,4-dihydroxy-2-naphthoate octaprenyltransferase
MRKLRKLELLPSREFVVLTAVWVACVTAIIKASGAPFWTLYIVLLSAAPLMIRELRAMDTRHQENKAKKKPLAKRVGQGQKAA